MIVKKISNDSEIWPLTINYSENCSWGAGHNLAKHMRNNDFSGWERVFVALDESVIAGFCTLSKTDCIPDVFYTPYISFVFVGEKYRGDRLSELLIKTAINYAKSIDFKKVYLVSNNKGLYEKYGFTKIEEKKDFQGNLEQIFSMET
ncbi:MAG: GNAT family N-acetyltransferase [Clostridiales bacterium]|nr:GNAT family N-acetyltransferase [Clostridiales bacterium]